MSLGHSDETDISDAEPAEYAAEAVVLPKFDMHLYTSSLDKTHRDNDSSVVDPPPVSGEFDETEGHVPLLKDLEGEFLHFPNFGGCKITAGDPLPNGIVPVIHTTPLVARLGDVSAKTRLMERAEQPCPKLLAEKEKKCQKAEAKAAAKAAQQADAPERP
ncbi:hypothetical protein Tco_1201051 [Tanacetum coccineum]